MVQAYKKTIILGITGASGSIYAMRLLDELALQDIKVHIIVSKTGQDVVRYETNQSTEEVVKIITERKNTKANFIFEKYNDYFSSVASGSYKTAGMVILPCSVSTIGSIANGISTNLLHRAAAVCMKEKRKLILVPRETPLTSIDLQNLLTLSNNNATIMPASPGFYHIPKSYDDIINFMVGKILDMLEINHKLYKKWGDI